MKGLLLLIFSFGIISHLIAHENDFEIAISQEKKLKEVAQELTFHFGNGISKEILFALDIDEPPSKDVKVRLIWDKAKDMRKHGQFLGYPRDYYRGLSHEEQNDIRFIVNFLANHSILKIAAHRSDLEAAGDRIDQVHPLNFLAYVFCHEELKVCFHNIRSKGWVWGDFIGGLKESLMTEAKNSNMKDEYVRDFSKKVSCQGSLYPQIAPAVHEQNWNEFIHILMTQIPRSGDHDRHDD